MKGLEMFVKNRTGHPKAYENKDRYSPRTLSRITMNFMLPLLVALLALAAPEQNQAPPALPQILSRVAEEADVFYQNAPKALTQETLEQRALLPASRFRPRIGKAAVEAPSRACRSARSSPSTAWGPFASPDPRPPRVPPGGLGGRAPRAVRRERPARPLPRYPIPG